MKLRTGGKRIEADCLWRNRKLIIELDGRAAHDSTPAFEADRERDLRLLANGWMTGRVTSRRLGSKHLVQELRAILR